MRPASAALAPRRSAASASGTRSGVGPAPSSAIAAADLFLAPLMTALEPDELLVEIEVPPPPAGARSAFVEHARTHGDFAVAGAAVVRAGREHAAVALLGAGPTPVRAPDAEHALRHGASAAEAAAIAGAGLDDDYRRALTTELVRRALEEAQAA